MRFAWPLSLRSAISRRRLNRKSLPTAPLLFQPMCMDMRPDTSIKPDDTMTNSIAFLFPGQGSQAVGMGKELAALYPVAQETFDEADVALGYKLSQVCWEGPEEKLKLTEITQPAILTVSVAAFRVLESMGYQPSYVAGHSLGEYSAHVAAGTLSFTDAVKTVRNRGKYMQEAVPVGVGAMAAILALPLDSLREVCRE